MSSLVLGAYILAWPVVALGVLALIVGATLKEFHDAKANGHDVV